MRGGWRESRLWPGPSSPLSLFWAWAKLRSVSNSAMMCCRVDVSSVGSRVCRTVFYPQDRVWVLKNGKLGGARWRCGFVQISSEPFIPTGLEHRNSAVGGR